MRLLLHSRLRRGDPIPICIGVPQLDLPGFLPRLARSLIALTVIGGTLVVNAAVTTFATAAGRSYSDLHRSAPTRSSRFPSSPGPKPHCLDGHRWYSRGECGCYYIRDCGGAILC